MHEAKDEVNAFLADSFFDPVLETDRQGRIVARVVNIRAPPPKLSLRIGECVYAYRSALDHLADRLGVTHTGDPLPRDREDLDVPHR